MITIVAGSREITSYELISKAIENCPWPITEIISGGARGVDTLAIQYAKEHSIPFRVVEAEWERFGRGAGRKRNSEMVYTSDALLAIWDGISPGTKHCIGAAKKRGLKSRVFIVDVPDK